MVVGIWIEFSYATVTKAPLPLKAMSIRVAKIKFFICFLILITNNSIPSICLSREIYVFLKKSKMPRSKKNIYNIHAKPILFDPNTYTNIGQKHNMQTLCQHKPIADLRSKKIPIGFILLSRR